MSMTEHKGLTGLERMALALQGIEACDTDCKCCRLHANIAREVLDLVGRVPPPPLPLCKCGRTICAPCKHPALAVPQGTLVLTALTCGCLDRCTGICKEPPYGIPYAEAVPHVSV